MLEIQSREVKSPQLSPGEIPFYKIENDILRSQDAHLIAGYFLLLKQGRTARNFYHEGKNYALSRGEVLTGRGMLGKALGTSENVGKRVLDQLRRIGAITLQYRLFRASIYAVENWESRKFFAQRVPDVFPDVDTPGPGINSGVAMGIETDEIPMDLRQQESFIENKREQQHADSENRRHESGTHEASALENEGINPKSGDRKPSLLDPIHRFRLSEEAFSRADEMGVFAQYGHSYLDFLWEFMKTKPGIRNKEGWVTQALKKAWMIEEFEESILPPAAREIPGLAPDLDQEGPEIGQEPSPGDKNELTIDASEMIAIIRNKELQIRDIMKKSRIHKKYSTRPTEDPVFQMSARAIYNEFLKS